MKIKMCKIEFETDIDLVEEDLKQVRGYIGNEFSEYVLLHNHEDDKLRYSYPLVQYKFIRKKLSILGINEGADTLLTIIPNLSKFSLNLKNVNIIKKNIEMWEDEIKLNTGYKIYKFESPYLAFSQKNYQLYKSLESKEEQKKLIDKILIGNILSFFKGIGLWVDTKLIADMFLEKDYIVDFKKQNIIGLKGEFAFNGILPNYIGLGKSVSLGHGSIKRR